MTEDEIYTLIGSWVREVAKQTGNEGAIAIRESETGPRPTATKSGSACVVPATGLYVTMQIAAIDEVQSCGPTIQGEGDCFEEVMCCLSEATIDLQTYRCGAFDFIRALRASLKLPSMASGSFPNMSVRDLGAVTNISQIIKGLKEERAALSITLGFTESVSCAVPLLTLECDPCFDPCADEETPTIIEECANGHL